MRISIPYDIGDHVMIDGDVSIKAVILAFMVVGKGHNIRIEVSWTHNGSICSAWVEDWRLTLWEE